MTSLFKMQYDAKYDGVDAFKAITLRAEDADAVAKGEVDHLLLRVSSPYRGEVLLVTKPTPVGERSGMMVGRATIKEVKRVKGGFLWKFSDARRVIEFPCQKATMKGVVWDCYYTKGVVADYPRISLRKILFNDKHKKK